jgi:hypothetical protein
VSPRSAAAARRTSARPAAPARRPRLRAVPDAVTRPARTPFVVLVLLVLAAGLVGLLLLNTSLQQGSFHLAELERSTTELRDRQQALAREVALLEAPGSLARRAMSLGMIPDTSPAYLRLPEGSVTGDLEPAGASP